MLSVTTREANSGQYIPPFSTINRKLDIKLLIYVFRVKVSEAFPLKPRFEVPLVLQQVAETCRNLEILNFWISILIYEIMKLEITLIGADSR